MTIKPETLTKLRRALDFLAEGKTQKEALELSGLTYQQLNWHMNTYLSYKHALVCASVIGEIRSADSSLYEGDPELDQAYQSLKGKLDEVVEMRFSEFELEKGGNND